MNESSAVATASASETRVREFRQILILPVQLSPVPDSREAAAHWSRLNAGDNPWHEVVDEFREHQTLSETHYAEFVAFMPDVQRFLYGEGEMRNGPTAYGPSPIHVFRRQDVAQLRAVLRPGDAPIVFRVPRTELYFFYDIDLAILAVELVGLDLTLAQAQDALFRIGRAYPTSWTAEGHGANCCERIELLAADGRVLAVSDYEDKQSYLRFVHRYRAVRVASHFAFLLEPLALQQAGGAGAILYRQLEHQRLPQISWLAVDDPYRIARADWVRLGLASPAGDPGVAPLAPRFLANFEETYCYDRFWDPGGEHDRTPTRVLCSGQALTMIGHAGNPGFTNGESGILAQFRHQYFLLALIVHFHRAALLVFRNRLAAATGVLQDYRKETISRFRREVRLTHENFLRFVHRYWFQEVSNQAPSRDMFNLWIRHLGTDRLFIEVRQEVEDMISYLDSDGLRRQANTVVRLTVVTFFGLIGTVTAAFLGMGMIDLALHPPHHRVAYFLLVATPVAALTFYTAAKSHRLAAFLETLADERQSTFGKVGALMGVWRRRR